MDSSEETLATSAREPMMPSKARGNDAMRELDEGYTSEVDTTDERGWCDTLQAFDDANIYQTWAYAAVISGRLGMSHLIVKRRGEILAVAQARIAKIPFLNIGIAYVRWGPLWRRHACGENPDIFRQAIRALRNEYVVKRRLVLRLFPGVFDGDGALFPKILPEEGFSLATQEPRSRTILMDLTPSLEELHDGMARSWRRNLRNAERGDLEVIDGSEPELFKAVIDIYGQTISRKKFVAPRDLSRLGSVQVRLPDELKMGAMLCRSRREVCAGLIWSAMGDTALELVAATTDVGLRTHGSHLLRWKLVEKLKQRHVALYNLNGINPTANPGTYRFKNELAGKNGRDVHFLGRFDSSANAFSRWCVECGDRLRASRSRFKEMTKAARAVSLPQRGMKQGA